MVDFASYKAQLPTIQVPSLMGYESQQEENMWKKAGATLENINKIAIEEYSYKAKEEAKEKAVLDVEAGIDLKDVPKANTIYGQQYEESATEAYLAQLSIDTTENLTKLNAQYGEHPEKLKQMQAQYIKGTVDNLPIPIRPSVNKSLSLTAASDYSVALRKFNAKQEAVNKEMALVNLYKLKEEVSNYPEPQNEIEIAAQAQKNAQIEASLEYGLKTRAISAKEYQMHIEDIKESKINNYIYNRFINNQNDPEKLMEIEEAILNGTTGNPLIDNSSEEQRVNYLMVTQNKFRQVQASKKAVERDVIEKKENERLDMMLEKEKYLTNNWVAFAPEEREKMINEMEALASSRSELNHINSLRKSYIENVKTPSSIKRSLMEDWTAGELDMEEVNRYLEAGNLSMNDYNFFFNKYSGKEGFITRSAQYKELMSQVKIDYKIAESKLSLLTDPEQIRNSQMLELARGIILNKIEAEEIKTPADITTYKEEILKTLRDTKEPLKILNINGNEITDPVQIETISKAKNVSPKIAQATKQIQDQVNYYKENKQFSKKKLAEYIKDTKEKLNLTEEEEEALGAFLLTYTQGAAE